jgi:hypothetical protein
VEQPITIDKPVIRLDEPLKEGETKVSGRATGVKKVRVMVYGGWATRQTAEKKLVPLYENYTAVKTEQRDIVANRTLAEGRKNAALMNIKKQDEALAAAEREIGELRLKEKLTGGRNDEKSKEEQAKILNQVTAAEDKKTVAERHKQEQKQVLAAAEREFGVLGEAALVAQQRMELTKDKLQVEVCLESEPLQRSEPVEVTATNFTVSLERPLNAGDCVVAVPVFPKAIDYVPESVITHPAEVQSTLLDWGRVRGYFTIGGGISQYRKQFSEVDTFIGFTSDTRIWGNVLEPDPLRVITREKSQVKGDDDLGGGIAGLKRFRFQVNLFMDARVAVKVAETGASTTAADATTAPSVITPPTQLAYNSRQPGFFQFGIHLPMSYQGMDWTHRGKQYSMFVSPIFKAGGATYDDGQVIYRHVVYDLNKLEKDGRYEVHANEVCTGVLPFWGTGTRIGFFEYTRLGKQFREQQVANDLVGYFDFTYGRDRGFLSYRFDRQPIGGDAAAGLLQRGSLEVWSAMRPRYSIEARLKVPYLPALIGVDANIRTRSRADEPNMLRFVVAFRIDAQRALSRVFGQIK